MLLIGCYASVCKDGMPALPFISKREKPQGFEPLAGLLSCLDFLRDNLVNQLKGILSPLFHSYL